MSALELRDVTKRYASDGEVVHAVDGASLTVGPGEFVALFGPSGSGKTTLLLLAGALLPPDAGRVCFGGRDLSGLKPLEAAKYRRRELGFIFQSFHLMHGSSALDNAALKLLASGWTMKDAREQARPWLERVGLAHRATHKPSRMSTGERQRVAIARALAGDPQLLLADEPTGNLDTTRGLEILHLLRDLCHERQIPVLLVTHDPQAIELVDRVQTLRDGRIIDGLDMPTPLLGSGA